MDGFIRWLQTVPILGLLILVPTAQKWQAAKETLVIGLIGTGPLWIPALFASMNIDPHFTIFTVLSRAVADSQRGDLLLICPPLLAPIFLLFFDDIVGSAQDNVIQRKHKRALLLLAILLGSATMIEFAILITSGIKDADFRSRSAYGALFLTLVTLYAFNLIDDIPNDATSLLTDEPEDLLDKTRKLRA